MNPAIEIEADRIALSGCRAGRAIWSAIECASEAGLPSRKARRLFDVLVDDMSEELPEAEAALFQASAYEALPLSATSTIERAEIDTNAWRAYDDYCDTMVDELAADAADHRAATARDEVSP